MGETNVKYQRKAKSPSTPILLRLMPPGRHQSLIRMRFLRYPPVFRAARAMQVFIGGR